MPAPSGLDDGAMVDRTGTRLSDECASFLRSEKREGRILSWFDTERGYCWIRHHDDDGNRVWSRFDYDRITGRMKA